MYADFIEEARRTVPVETGRFRAHMVVTSVNDGPVTLIMDSRNHGD
jgi:D-tyrosyl-tRNA(Tyr) deacylase